MAHKNVSQKEQDVMDELKIRTLKDLPANLLEDETLFYRFCKARDFNINDAEAMLRKHITWRKEFKMDSFNDYKPPELFLKYVPATFRCFDKEGCVVRYTDFGGADLKGLVRSSKKSEAVKYFVFLHQQDIDITEQRSKELGIPLTNVIFIYNHTGLNFLKATDLKVADFSIAFLKVFQDNFPERLKLMIHINSSSYFQMMYKLAKPFIAPALHQKNRFYGTADGWKEELLKLIDADQLPAFLGGNRTDPDGNPLCKTFVLHGAKVPRKYYFQKSAKTMCSRPGVRKLVIGRFDKAEIPLEVSKPDSNLEWEFETAHNDIGFAVFYHEDAALVEVVPKRRLDSYFEPERGIYRCEKEGKYTIVFDNSYSWFRQKEIFYFLRVGNPDDISADAEE